MKKDKEVAPEVDEYGAKYQPSEHIPEHFFKLVCVCPCNKCTQKLTRGRVRCICKMCPPIKCGGKDDRNDGYVSINSPGSAPIGFSSKPQ